MNAFLAYCIAVAILVAWYAGRAQCSNTTADVQSSEAPQWWFYVVPAHPTEYGRACPEIGWRPYWSDKKRAKQF